MTQPWAPQDVPWFTVQFFMDGETGDVDEVSYQKGTRKLRCTCSPPGSPVCVHVLLVDVRRDAAGVIGMELDESAQAEIATRGLDHHDPAVLRDLLRRYGHIEVL